MYFLRVLFVLSLLATMPACARLNPFRGAEPAPTAAAAETPVIGRKTTPRGLSMEIRASPDTVKLGESRQVQVTVTVRNNGKRAANFKFPTSQEIEILFRDASGKALSTWSADRTFDAQPRFVVLNAQERFEFSEALTTRDLQAGKTYALEAYLVGYENELRVSRPVIPQP